MEVEKKDWEEDWGPALALDEVPNQFLPAGLVSFLIHTLLLVAGVFCIIFLPKPHQQDTPLMIDLHALETPKTTPAPKPLLEKPQKEPEKIITKDTPRKDIPKTIGKNDNPESIKPPSSIARNVPKNDRPNDSKTTNQKQSLAQPPKADSFTKQNPTQQQKAPAESKPDLYDPASDYLKKQPIETENVPKVDIPPELKQIIAKSSPNSTNSPNLNYVMNDYSWSYQTYVEQWGRKIIDWWRAPTDYISGLVPKGGSLWIKAVINRQGKLLSFEVYKSGVTPEMQRKALQALISSFEIPPLPQDFPEKIHFYWQFVYPPIGQPFDAKRQ